MAKYKKLFLAVVLCASASLSLPSKSLASDGILATYDQCMSWCMTQNDFFTCDAYCDYWYPYAT
jgi:hypothetical protein